MMQVKACLLMMTGLDVSSNDAESRRFTQSYQGADERSQLPQPELLEKQCQSRR